MTKQVLKIKNINRVGKVTFESKYGEVLLEVYKQKGGQLYRVKVDGICKGINRVEASQCWGWLGEYFGILIEQESKPTPKKTGQSKWR